MLPVIAIVGRPNVGKSTLFNRLTKTRNALVADLAGVTRDRQYGQAEIADRRFIVIDTGGLGLHEDELESSRADQAQLAIDEADIIFFMVDAKAGLTGIDENIAEYCRIQHKKTYLLVNKADGLNYEIAKSDFYQTGFEHIYAISAQHGDHIHELMHLIAEQFAIPVQQDDLAQQHDAIKLAIIGRPNVGKSTLVNRLLGEERVVVFDKPGTTTDSVYIPFERRDTHYVIIDTAGIRRKSKVDRGVEKFSVVKTLQALSDCHVACVVVDAKEGVTDQDLHIIGYAIEAGRAIIIIINKWDSLSEAQKQKVKMDLDRKLEFVSFAKKHRTSALHGTGVGDLFEYIDNAYRSAMIDVSTSKLNTILREALTVHQPPLVRGRRIKLKYIHQGGHNPPRFIIHGTQAEKLPDSYQRFLANFFREKLRLVATPLAIQLKSGDNPYQGRKNTLTARQENKRRRLKRFLKKNKKR